MHNLTDRSEALSYLADLYACYRDFQNMAVNTSGGVREAWQAKASKAREAARTAIFFIRENDYSMEWN